MYSGSVSVLDSDSVPVPDSDSGLSVDSDSISESVSSPDSASVIEPALDSDNLPLPSLTWVPRLTIAVAEGKVKGIREQGQELEQ
ncbi:hypothetical protein BGX33_011499 [Mortierella sp. NVP41]|nr:hypothetical protein BGX33_011499 [Mortierella sp. NVP41]